jgi:hypothetical protein
VFRFLLLRLADALVKAAMGKVVEKALPVILDRIDDEMPQLLSESLGGGFLSGRLAGAISDAIGKPVQPGQVDAVVRVYDPRKAADKARRKAEKAARRASK